MHGQAVVTMPESLFKTSGKGGTHTKVCVLILQEQTPGKAYGIFMAEAKWCGHDSRGNPTLRKIRNGGFELSWTTFQRLSSDTKSL